MLNFNTATVADVAIIEDADLVEMHIAMLETEPFSDDEIDAAFGGEPVWL